MVITNINNIQSIILINIYFGIICNFLMNNCSLWCKIYIIPKIGGDILNNAKTIKYLKDLYEDTKGYITLARIINGKFRQHHYTIKKLLENPLCLRNTFVSTNTFYIPRRVLENIKEYHVFFIDLDIYKVGFTKEQALYYLFEDYICSIGKSYIPCPTYIVDSGGGLYLIWKIKPVPYMASSLWKAIEESLYNKLKDLGADRKSIDATRILRIPGSINGKYGTTVKIIYNTETDYDIQFFKRECLPELSEKNYNKKTKKVALIYRERSLYQLRIKDIAKLCELRNYDVKGSREFILFLYRYYLCYFLDDKEQALADALELNSMFKEPLPEREVIRATKSAEKMYLNPKSDYKYKNETLINQLGITSQEEQSMLTIISQKEKARRKNIYKKNKYYRTLKEHGKLTKTEQIKQREKEILDLLKHGLKQKEICKYLNISPKTYKRHTKRLNPKN